MGEDLLSFIEHGFQDNQSLSDLKKQLMEKGFLEDEIDTEIERFAARVHSDKALSSKKLSKLFALKEIFDRIGYGFVSNPFINILFLHSGASYFFIAFVNGLKMILSLFLSSYFKEFSKVHYIGKKLIKRGGVIFGFSFLLMAVGRVVKNPLIFAFAILIGCAAVVTHGEFYLRFLRENLSDKNRGFFLTKVAYFGILITALSLLISGFVMDFFPSSGSFKINLFGKSIAVYGYLICFEITAFVFIISSYVLSFIKENIVVSKTRVFSFFGEFFSRAKLHMGVFLNNKIVLLLALTSAISGILQVLGTSFYGIFIYEFFKTSFLGGFLNVSFVFVIAVLVSFLGPLVTRKLKDYIGVSPMLVFGTLLSAMLPLALVYNRSIAVVCAASALSILGGSIVGVGQSLFTRKLLFEEERRIYFSFLGFVTALPLLILVPFGSYLVGAVGLTTFFKILIFATCFIVAPLYFLMVILYERTLHQKI
ncbi:MAG: hypothetical protein KKC26_04815 [Nanoarchaeota archaeon]|nr:hypothetical protein [Nanoarchaeota archaeon]MBU1850277.1 hypothetical protein [Nanoarchaeota archaeon]